MKDAVRTVHAVVRCAWCEWAAGMTGETEDEVASFLHGRLLAHAAGERHRHALDTLRIILATRAMAERQRLAQCAADAAGAQLIRAHTQADRTAARQRFHGC